MANAYFFSPDGGTTRYLLEDTEGRTTYEEEIHGVNLLTLEACFSDISGVTRTINSDNSVTINGTATNTKNVYFSQRFAKSATILDVGRYILSVGASIPSTCRLHVSYSAIDGSNVVVAWGDYGANTITFDAPIKDRPWNVLMEVGNGTNFNNLILYPMIRKADIEDSTYRPYNYQAIQNQLNAQGVLGAKNLLPNNATSQTINGVTFTVNDDGSVTVNGTSSSNGSFDVSLNNNAISNLRGEYIVSLTNNLPGGLQFWIAMSDDNNIPINPGQNTVKINCTDARHFKGRTNFYVNAADVTVNNYIAYPMIRLASDPDDTYQPYAMPNRELTEKVFEKRILTSSDNLNDVTDTGIYGFTTAPINSPESVSYGTLIVQKTNDSDIRQLVLKSGELIYQRDRGGNPSAWHSWYKFTGTVVS